MNIIWHKHTLVTPFLMWLIVSCEFFIILMVVPQNFLFAPHGYAMIIALPALVFWAYCLISAIYVHHKAPLSVTQIDVLVTHGIYARMRHPIYTADIVAGWAVFFIYPDARILLCACFLTITLLYWIEREENALIAKFGDDYRNYQKIVPKFIPKIK